MVVQHVFVAKRQRRVSLRTASALMSDFMSRNKSKQGADGAPLTQADRLEALSDDALEKLGKAIEGINSQISTDATATEDVDKDEEWPQKPTKKVGTAKRTRASSEDAASGGSKKRRS